MPAKEEAKTKFLMLYDMSKEERVRKGYPVSWKSMAKYLGVTQQTLINWRKELENGEVNKVDIEVPTEDKIKLFDDLLFQLASSPNSPAKYKELFARRYGLLLDKIEETHKLEVTADDYFRIRREAENRVREHNEQLGGDRSVLPEPHLLPEQVCVDTEQEHGEDGEVGGVGLPAQPA